MHGFLRENEEVAKSLALHEEQHVVVEVEVEQLGFLLAFGLHSLFFVAEHLFYSEILGGDCLEVLFEVVEVVGAWPERDNEGFVAETVYDLG